MRIKDLITGNKTGRHLPVRREEEHPIVTLQRQMNQLFDSLFYGGEATIPEDVDVWRADFSPRIDVKETETVIEITAELPGMDEKDVDVSLDRDVLVLKGEKKEKKEEKDKNYWHVERRYGSFHSRMPAWFNMPASLFHVLSIKRCCIQSNYGILPRKSFLHPLPHARHFIAVPCRYRSLAEEKREELFHQTDCFFRDGYSFKDSAFPIFFIFFHGE